MLPNPLAAPLINWQLLHRGSEEETGCMLCLLIAGCVLDQSRIVARVVVHLVINTIQYQSLLVLVLVLLVLLRCTSPLPVAVGLELQLEVDFNLKFEVSPSSKVAAVRPRVIIMMMVDGT